MTPVRRALLASVLGAAALGAGAPPRTAVHPVHVRQYAFAPDSLVVALGDTVEWDNGDLVPHTVTSDTTAWDSGDIATAHRYRVVATARGRTAYHCEIHPEMHGLLVVR